jgi:hypothetical protein
MLLRVVLAFVALKLVIAASVQVQSAIPPRDPILRIDAGMHTGPVFRIGGEAACRLLATGSCDNDVTDLFSFYWQFALRGRSRI